MNALELSQIFPHLHRLADTCNVYVLRIGSAALLIDAGSGAVADRVGELGVEQIEWVLHTHHHRDQSWGAGRLRERGARVAVPEYERHLFDQVETYWQTRRIFDNYNDRSTFFTLAASVTVDAMLEDYEVFEWRGQRLLVLPAKGHTFGSLALVTEIDGARVAFTGDLLARDGKLADLHSMEYMYGGLEGLAFTLQSIRALRRQHLDIALPSHGEPITNVDRDIGRLEDRIMECVALGSGLGVGGHSTPSSAYFLAKFQMHPISRHLVWGGASTCSNFYVLLSESGKALFIDYGHAFLAHCHVYADHEGLETTRFIEHRIVDLQERFGVMCIEVVIPTHIHDDHTCGIPYLQRHHGTQCWALEEVAQVIEHPAAWASTPCVFPKPIRVDRRLRDGERFCWEGYEFEIHFAPGQTEFHSVISTHIDGRKVAFTGDNYFVHEVVRENRIDQRPYQSTVMRNSFQLNMHRRCAEVMRRVSPELICPGHGEYLACSKDDIDAYCDFIVRKEQVFRGLVGEPADDHIDLFWARLLPYVASIAPGGRVDYELRIRNNLERRASYAARLLPPAGWRASNEYTTIDVEAGGRESLHLSMSGPSVADGVRRLVTAEVLVNGRSRGPVCEAIVSTHPPSDGLRHRGG